jgi:hypothetical protein
MRSLFEWTLANPAEAGAFIAIIVAIVAAAVTFGLAKHSVKAGVLMLMLRYERARRKGQLPEIEGARVAELVVQWALTRVVPGLPWWLAWMKPYFTAERIQTMATTAWNTMIDYLDDGELNGTHPELPDEPASPGPAA